MQSIPFFPPLNIDRVQSSTPPHMTIHSTVPFMTIIAEKNADTIITTTIAKISKIRSNPRLLFVRVPYFLSFLCVVIGVVWLLLLPLNEYSRQTYISENALLPGQVHTYFSGSEQNVFRGFKKELVGLFGNGDGNGDWKLNESVYDEVQSILRAAGLKVATQNYEYTSAGIPHAGKNIYAIIHAPRGDATEAIVLVAPWRAIDGEMNINGVSLALTLARYFKRWSLWSKDIIFLFPPDSKSGTQAWIDAYHDMHPSTVQPLPLKSGALQGALVIEYPFDHGFDSIHIAYDGVNGQLPNLDLFNTAVSIAGGQIGIGVNLQEMWEHDDSYEKRLETILRGMVKQGLGYAAGAHSSFMPYHVDAITLQAKGDGWQDEMALGRTVESLCRSLNNLLEHLHQSFFFYLLMQANRFVSIGTYLPSAMLIAGNFTIMAIALWMRSGYYRAVHLKSPPPSPSPSPSPSRPVGTKEISDDPLEKSGTVAVDQGSTEKRDEKEGTKEENGIMERHLALPLTLVIGIHFLGLVPLYTFNKLFHKHFSNAIYSFIIIDLILPLLLASLLKNINLFLPTNPPTAQQYLLIKSFSLLLLGLFLSTLATLNFSLSFMIGLLCVPLSFVPPISNLNDNEHEGSTPTPTPTHTRPHPQTRTLTRKHCSIRSALSALGLVVLNLLSPPVVLSGACWWVGVGVEDVLVKAAFGWDVWGMWTQVIVWCVWWPGWLVGGVLLGSLLL